MTKGLKSLPLSRKAHWIIRHKRKWQGHWSLGSLVFLAIVVGFGYTVEGRINRSLR